MWYLEYARICAYAMIILSVAVQASTLHDVKNQDRAPSLKLEVETVSESTLQARYKSKGGRWIVERGAK